MNTLRNFIMLGNCFIAITAYSMHGGYPLHMFEQQSEVHQRNLTSGKEEIKQPVQDSVKDSMQKNRDNNVTWARYCKMKCLYCVTLVLSFGLALVPAAIQCYFMDQCPI